MKKLVFIVLSGLLCLINQESYSQISTNEKPISFGNTLEKVSEQNIPNKVMPSLDMIRINREDKEDDGNGVPPRFGYSHPVNYNLNNSGQWVNLPDGNRLWRLSISCPNALSINLLYDKFWLPVGSKFFVYNEVTHQTIGAITSEYIDGSKNNLSKFATGLIYGEEVIFEYFSPPYVKDMPEIVINRIDYGYRFIDNPYKTNKNFGESGGCNTNVNCPEGVNWQKEKNAIARISIVFPSGSG